MIVQATLHTWNLSTLNAETPYAKDKYKPL